MKELKDLLEKLGFSQNSIKAYVELLKRGESLTGYEISSGSGIPLSKIYEVLNSLVSKGLVYEIPGKPKKFKVVEPRSSLNNFIYDKKKEIELLLDELNEIKFPKINKNKLAVYKGNDRMAVFQDDLINTQKYSYSFLQSLPAMDHPISKIIQKKLKSGVDIKGIIYPNEKNRLARELWNKKFPDVYKIGSVLQESRMGVIDDKIVRFTVFSDGELVMIRIEDEDLAKIFKEAFILKWKSIR